jgi:hypothetical protein
VPDAGEKVALVARDGNSRLAQNVNLDFSFAIFFT